MVRQLPSKSRIIYKRHWMSWELRYLIYHYYGKIISKHWLTIIPTFSRYARHDTYYLRSYSESSSFDYRILRIYFVVVNFLNSKRLVRYPTYFRGDYTQEDGHQRYVWIQCHYSSREVRLPASPFFVYEM